MKLLYASIAAALIAAPAFAQDGEHTPDPVNGEAVYTQWCAICHNPGPAHNPGTAALTKKYAGTDTNPVLAERGGIPAPMVEYFVRNGVSVMPFFRKTEISDDDLAHIAAWLNRDAE